MKKGTLYKSGDRSGELYVGRIVNLLKKTAWVVGKLGTGLMAVAAFGMLFVYMPLAWAEFRYGVSQTRVAKGIGQIKENASGGVVLVKEEQVDTKPGEEVKLKPKWEVPDEAYSIYIPKIFARSRVIPEVDAGNSREYMAALKEGVAEAKGLAHAGEVGTTFLFAHSVASRVDFARYNAVFYLLDKLEYGDQIEVVREGKLYKYEVAEIEILPPTDTKYLVPQNLSEKLVLQTCYPPGTTKKRLIVVARRID